MTDVEEVETSPAEAELERFRQWQRDNASQEAVELAESGAKPTQVDANAMMDQIRQLQQRLDTMSAAQGIPSDPLAAKVQALKAHVQLQANANPSYDFSELIDALNKVPDKSSDLTSDDTDLARETVTDHVERFGPIAHELAYVRYLANDIHRDVLKAKRDQKANA